MQLASATQAFSPSSVCQIPQGPGQIAIDVSHAAVGLIDILILEGRFKAVPGMAQPPYIPGLEVAGTIRAVGAGVTEFVIGEKVVSMSAGPRTGGYASVYVAPVGGVVSIENSGVDPALAVATIPNAAMAHVALTRVAHLEASESVLVLDALGGIPRCWSCSLQQAGGGIAHQAALRPAR